MATITLKGNPIHTIGDLPEVQSLSQDFLMTKKDLSDVSLISFRGKKVILNIFPSIDTSVCATSVRKFNIQAAKLSDTVVLCVSMDLPFALQRFCGAEGIDRVESVSVFRFTDFGKKYGMEITDGPLKGLLARSIIVLDQNGTVIYTELVPEIAQEPDYEKALVAIHL